MKVDTPEALEQVKAAIQDYAAAWPVDGPIDWDEYLGFLEDELDLDLPSDYDHPVMKQIKRLIKAVHSVALMNHCPICDAALEEESLCSDCDDALAEDDALHDFLLTSPPEQAFTGAVLLYDRITA